MERQVEPGDATLTREVVAFAAVGTCSIVAWHALILLIAGGRAYLCAEGPLHDALLPLLRLAVSCAAAVYVIRETGLLALARRQAVAHATGSDWWRWLAHFKLSLAALSVTCVVAGFARVELLLWLLLGPYPAESRADARFYWSSPAERAQAEALIVMVTTWIVALPFMASDAWRLLLSPRSNQRAKLLRVPFAVVTGLVALGVLALVREYAQSFFWSLVHFDSSLSKR